MGHVARFVPDRGRALGNVRAVARWRLIVAVSLVLGMSNLVLGIARADQTSPYCTSTADANNDKYECSTTVSTPDFSTGTRTMSQWRWMGSLGSGGFSCCWRMVGIDVYDTDPSTYARRYYARYGAEANSHSNQSYPGYTYAYVFNLGGITSNGDTYYCFQYTNNAYYDINGTYHPAQGFHASWANVLDSNYGYENSGTGCAAG